MREIKFRAWDKYEERMGEVSFIKYSNVQYHQVSARFNQKERVVDEWFNFGSEDGSDNIILMQYTGIKDCNGVEIYEGDILNVSKEYSGSFSPTQVIFENGAFRTQISHMHNPVPLTEERALTLEIIGNIHQNKELLTA